MTTTMIKTNNLYPHPDNPRQSPGDLSELVDSIKANGVLQNLTVVPWFSSITRAPADDHTMDGCYRVVIGHRRLEAAKQAGIEELPCNIVEMSPKEQMTTMLMENMQREELTPYEQAQGFQMMMDLGISKNEIQERTGFSRTTVDHRLHLLELDQDVLEGAGDQIRMSDLISLEKIKDAEVKNRILREHGGKDTFGSELARAMEEQKAEEWREKVCSEIKGSTYNITIKKDAEKGMMRYIGNLSRYSDVPCTSASIDKILENDGVGLDEEVIAEERYGFFYFYAPIKEVDESETTEAAGSGDEGMTKEQREKQEKRDRYAEASNKLEEYTNAANEKRKAWIKEFIAVGKPIDYEAVVRFSEALMVKVGYGIYVNSADVAAVITENYIDCLKDWDEDEEDFKRQHGGKSIIEFTDQQLLQAAPGQVTLARLAVMELSFTEGKEETMYIGCLPKKNNTAEAGYKMLQAMGYVMDDWERGLLDGTLEEFVTLEE